MTQADGYYRGAGAVVLACLLCACVAMPERPVTNPFAVPSDKILVVGKVELHPQLRPDEQSLRTSFGKDFRNVFILYCGDQVRDLRAKRPESFSGSFMVTLDQGFYLKVDRAPALYVSGGMFYAVYDPPFAIETRVFSSVYKADLRPDDDAVYIGTVQYYRDESNKLTMVTVRDDYEWANSEFQTMFGSYRKLRKALPAPVSSGR